MNDHELSTLLRETADAQLGPLLASPPGIDAIGSPSASPRSRRPWLASVAAALIALGIGVAVLASRDDQQRVVTDDPAPVSEPLPTEPHARLLEAIERTRAGGAATVSQIVVDSGPSAGVVAGTEASIRWTYQADLVAWAWQTDGTTTPARVLHETSNARTYWERADGRWETATTSVNFLSDPLTNLADARCVVPASDAELAVFTTLSTEGGSACPATADEPDATVHLRSDGRIDRVLLWPFPSRRAAHEEITFDYGARDPILTPERAQRVASPATIRWSDPDSWPRAEYRTQPDATTATPVDPDLPERIPVVDHQGDVVGTIARDDFLNPSLNRPGDSARDSALAVTGQNGSTVGYMIGVYGFVPLNDAEQLFSDLEAGRTPVVPPKAIEMNGNP